MNRLLERLLKEIAAWHKNTFDTDVATQQLKLEEEYSEIRKTISTKDWYKELADVVIVSAALYYRFGVEESLQNIKFLWNILSREQRNILYLEVRRKFRENMDRKWERKNDGTYHHI